MACIIIIVHTIKEALMCLFNLNCVLENGSCYHYIYIYIYIYFFWGGGGGGGGQGGLSKRLTDTLNWDQNLLYQSFKHFSNHNTFWSQAKVCLE